MLQNKVKSMEFTLREGGVEPESLIFLWTSLDLDSRPPGVDYILLDTSVVCGLDPTLHWIKLVDRVPVCELSYIIAIEHCRRRRHALNPDWTSLRSVLTNRLNRVKRRAIRMNIFQEKYDAVPALPTLLAVDSHH